MLHLEAKQVVKEVEVARTKVHHQVKTNLVAEKVPMYLMMITLVPLIAIAVKIVMKISVQVMIL